MGLTANLDYGTETVTVKGLSKEMDVCGLADELFNALESVPKAEKFNEDIPAAAVVVNAILKTHDFPEIAKPIAAYKFAQDVMARAFEIKKEACAAWNSGEEPALHDSSLACE
jgi:hypothetical protein